MTTFRFLIAVLVDINHRRDQMYKSPLHKKDEFSCPPVSRLWRVLEDLYVACPDIAYHGSDDLPQPIRSEGRQIFILDGKGHLLAFGFGRIRSI